MSEMIGMDVDAVRRIASELRRKAGEIRAVETRVDSIVGQITGSWQGNTARRFVSDWHGHHRAALLLLANRVDGLGQSALNNAGEQETASGGRAHSSGPGSFGLGLIDGLLTGFGALGTAGGPDLGFFGEAIAEIGFYAYDAVDALNFVTSNSPISTLTAFDVPIVKIANNPWFHGAGIGIAVIGGAWNVRNAWEMSEGRSPVGRGVIVGGSIASDVLLTRVPVVAAADTITGGAIRADLAAVTNIAGFGLDGAASGFMESARNSTHNDLPGFALDVVSGTAGGFVDGANDGLNTWDKAVGEGKFGGFMKGFRDTENDVIDWLMGNG